jgi:uncharacterized protein (DUF58 family)
MNAVHPATTEARISKNMRRIEIATRRLSNDSFHGAVQSRFRGRGMDFEELREYAPGDDVRAIDWNASARTGRTFVKRYREGRQLTVVFVVDMSASGSLGAGDSSKRDQSVEIAGVLALSALRSDHRVGLVLFSDSVEKVIAAARGRAHTLRLVRSLIAFEPAGTGTNLGGALKELREQLRRRAVVVVLSDFLLPESHDGEARKELALLARRHDVVCIRTGDKHDRELPSVGLLTVEDVETGEIVEMDTGSARQRLALARAVEESNERMRAMIRGAKAGLVEVDTLKPYLGPLVGYFKSHGGRP